MSVLEQIIDWAKTIPSWQGEAVRRLLQQESLTSEDESQLYSLLKSAHGLTEPGAPPGTVLPLAVNDPLTARPSRNVVLKKIHGLKHVNALAADQCLEFAPSGVTVIYGENAAGKSGYSRALKRACHAREKKTAVLPNVFTGSAKRQPQAAFDLSVDGTDVTETWVASDPSPETLSHIAVFDSSCARIFVDDANDVVYMPYGLDVFVHLATLCKTFKDKLDGEIRLLPAPPSVLVEFSGDTAAGKLVASLKHDTLPQTVEALAKFLDTDAQRLVDLERLVAEINASDPKLKATRLRRQARRLDSLRVAVEKLHLSLSDASVDGLRSLQSAAAVAREAVTVASTQTFKDEPLPGVGGDAWRLMFEAARRFSETVAYPEEPFPVIQPSSLCVLCQQPLAEEAQDRMRRFADFVKLDVERVSAEKGAAFTAAVAAFGKTDIAPNKQDAELVGELRELSPEVADKLQSYLLLAAQRFSAVQAACGTGKWDGVSAGTASPAEALKGLVERLNAEAANLENAAQPSELSSLQLELRDLRDRKRLTDHKDEVIKHVARLKTEQCLRQCLGETETAAITRKGSSLMEQAVTGTLQKSLETELGHLGVKHIAFTLRKSGSQGQTRHQLQLAGIKVDRVDLSNILSEGEQRVVAIASFLAELQTASHNGGIIFDDPVCSLDHSYREKVARRLVAEGLHRQVIVFTHDIVFLLAINDAAARLQVSLMTQTIRRNGDEPGYCLCGLPWHAMKVDDRLKYIRNVLDEARRVLKAGDRDGYETLGSRCYGLLRETWERAVEEVVLNDVINRFRPSVETKRLRDVAIETADYVTIDNGMSKCSRWLTGHDSAGAIASPFPDPAEIDEDIKQLADFKRVKKRKGESDIRHERDAALEPPPVP